MKKVKLRTSLTQRGYSLIEMILAFGVMMILGGFAIPNIVTALDNMRLRGAASNVSGLVQRARITAVQHNATYTIAFGLPTGNGAYAYASSGSSTYSASDETVQFGGSVNQVAAPAGTAGNPTNLDASGGPLGWTATSGKFRSIREACRVTRQPLPAALMLTIFFISAIPAPLAAMGGWQFPSVPPVTRRSGSGMVRAGSINMRKNGKLMKHCKVIGLARTNPHGGFSLLELMVACMVMMIGLTGGLAVVLAAIAGNNRDKMDSTSTILSQMTMEMISSVSAELDC